MARKASKKDPVLVRIRVPSALVDSLDAHISSKGRKSRSNASSRSAMVVELLEGMIQALRDHREDFGKLLVAEAVREAAEKLQYTTVADVRRRLGAVPGAVLDRTLLTLEKEGVFQLAPSYNGNVLTAEERAGGVKDPRRGNLVYAVTDLAPE
ncbi:MAG: hypothetical protein ACAI25_02355, partial [Planctomycetota bacterium]